MTKAVQILAVFMTIIVMSSFTDKNAHKFIGTYSVSASDHAQIKLTINADHTFYYQDFSVSDKKIILKGNWTLKGKKVVLKNVDSQTKFHNVWSFVENGQVAKSRKGLSFYRLCKTDSM
jgi:hypothetical protein